METIGQIQFDQVTDRKCGNCTACCVWLGIEELKKHTAEKCKHLRGPAHTNKRCSIYASRPTACSEYKCLWRVGWGPDEWQPHRSGILITMYENEGGFEITMNIFDMEKAKNYITRISSQLIMIPNVVEVRVINIKGKKALRYKDGNIYNCYLLPSEGFESLMFAAEDVPIGHYAIR
jgi:Fe-S-cluster containining protein